MLHAPGDAGVVDVEPPVAGPGEAVVDVARVGVCGTDVELYTGELQYLRDGRSRFPLRPGHEWSGRVAAVGADVDPHPLIAATVGLDGVAAALSGDRPAGAGAGPKVHVSPGDEDTRATG